MTTPAFRTATDTKQGLNRRVAFTRIFSTDESEVIVDITKHMSEVHKVSLFCSKNTYINFDGDASSSVGADGTIHSFLLESGEAYTDDNICITSTITGINAVSGDYGEVRGVIWGR